jgi:PBP1b-binding outer membrane lipoprotein LpoB
MIKRTAGFLLVLLLSGCSLLPIETLSPTPTCPNGACETATLKPTTLVLTPTEIATQKPATAVPTLLDTPW